MTTTQGYSLVFSKYVQEIASDADLWVHDQTGARILSMRNSDENKVFGISFRTPPNDSTGVAHILEHSVLCGSRKYPVKEPFVDLLKGSLQTFLNAMTYPDKTCYPVASQNVQDFYNLIDVYLDAVFFPRISPHIFEQEGWHLDLPALDAPLAIKGVVYNEMKGVYSSPDAQLAELSQQSLFPDTTYGLDSGGHPRIIPRLSYADFVHFHEQYYHPSNAWIFFYGDDDPQKRLELVHEYLKEFQAQDIDSQVGLQMPVQEPRIVRGCFEARGPDQSLGMLTMNWLWPTKDDAQLVLACRILDGLLTGMHASPLRQALIESGLGEDLAGAGVEHELLQMYYSVGMKGVEPKNFTAVQDLIQTTLATIVHQGFDQDLVAAALNAVEFALRENNTGSYPRGLLVMLRALGTWLYDQDPLALVAFEAPLAALKKRLAQGERVFEEIIQTYILDNAHQTTVLMEPEPGYAARVDEAEEALIRELRQAQSQISDAQLVQRTEELRRIQETPDAPEDLALLPALTRKDIDPQIRMVPTEIESWDSATILQHDLPTNNIGYVDLALDLAGVPSRLLPLIPLFARSLTAMGTMKEDYISFSKRIHAHTGGVRARSLLTHQEQSSAPIAQLLIRSKAMHQSVSKMLAIIHDALVLVNFDQPQRFRQILLEERAGLEQAIVPSGHHFVGLRLRAPYHLADALQERMAGLDYLFFLRQLTKRVQEDWPAVLTDLQTLHQAVINAQDAVLNLTMEEQWLHTHADEFQGFLYSLPIAARPKETWTLDTVQDNQGLLAPAQVNYVGKVLNLKQEGYEFHGASLVACKYLRTSWLWEQIRVLGGAYGAFCNYGRLSGLMSLGSYRDPNILSTLKAFDQCGEFLETVNLDGAELLKAIIGTSGDLDPYQLPDAKGFSALMHHLMGVADETRQLIRHQVLDTEEKHIREFGSFLRQAAAQGSVCVLGGEDALTQAQEQGLVLDELIQI